MNASQRLDAVCEIAMGQAPSGDSYNQDGKGWPLIAGAGDFGEKYPACKKYTTEAARLSKPGDIVLGIRASIGEKVIADGEYCLGRGVAGLRGKSNLDSRYLWHWLTHSGPVLASKAKGATFKQVNKDDIGELEIILPGLSEQRRIAAILDQADALRAKRREALAQLDSLTQSIFVEMFGDPATNSMIWPNVKLKSILSMPLRNGLSPSNSGTVFAKVLTLSAITGNAFDSLAWKKSTFHSVPPDHQSVNENDFLICRGNGNLRLVGKGHFPTSSMEDVTFPDTMIAARIAPKYIVREYLQNLWNSDALRRQIEASARTTNGTFKVNQTMLEEMSFMLPPLPLQEIFATRIHSIETLRARHQASLTEFEILFNSLQHRAFRGEL